MKRSVITIALLGIFYFVNAGTIAVSLHTLTPTCLSAMADTTAPKKKSTGTNKDGTPDMRLKKNKEAAKATTTAPAPATPARPVSPAVTKPAPQQPGQPVTPQPASKTSDKVIGTDSKGRTIYEGPRGGHYYINKNGNKEYIKKT